MRQAFLKRSDLSDCSSTLGTVHIMRGVDSGNFIGARVLLGIFAYTVFVGNDLQI